MSGANCFWLLTVIQANINPTNPAQEKGIMVPVLSFISVHALDEPPSFTPFQYDKPRLLDPPSLTPFQ